MTAPKRIADRLLSIEEVVERIETINEDVCGSNHELLDKEIDTLKSIIRDAKRDK